MSLLIVGCGYVGRRVARRWRETLPQLAAGVEAIDREVIALTRGGASLTELESEGIQPLVADWLDGEIPWLLERATHVLVAVPHRPSQQGGEQTHCIGLANICRRLPNLERLVMLSTTGVYHQTDGQTVDEDSPALAERIGPRIALAAENWLNQNLDAARATSLRLAGIYGPDRIPLLAKLREQQPLPVADGDLNLIHVDDIVRVVHRLLIGPSPSRLYVLSDGHPVARKRFYEDVASIFGTPAPQFVEPDPESSRGQRSESNKRVDSKRILSELDMQLLYPNHLAGLKAIAQNNFQK